MDISFCTRYSTCAFNAYRATCGYPLKHMDSEIPGCTSEVPVSARCCGKQQAKDDSCQVFWPKSESKCQEEMKHHDCNRAMGRFQVCESINTEETPEQCALKTHCAGKSWEKSCGIWHQRLSHPFLCQARPNYQYCCLAKWMHDWPQTSHTLPAGCKAHWPKNLEECGKGCKAQVGGRVTYQQEKRDITSIQRIPLAAENASDFNPSDAISAKSRQESLPMSFTNTSKRDDRPWVEGDRILAVVDCKWGTRCALASWKNSCDKWHQKISPACWQRAPSYHTCCNGRGERKAPHNDACKDK
jgi:hypothetical protein